MHLERRLRRVVFGTARGTVHLGKKLHLKVRRTEGEPQLSLFFQLFRNSPTRERLARVSVVGGPFGRHDVI